MVFLLLLLLGVSCAGADTHQFLREIKVDKNSGLMAPPVEPGTLLDNALVDKLVETERQLLIADGYLDPKVKPEIVKVNSEQADLHLHSEPGPRSVVYEVRFAGDPVLPESELAHALHETRVHRVWRVLWISHPAYSETAAEDDAAGLKSFYYSRGYFDAEVKVSGTEFDGAHAILTYSVNAGRHYELASPVKEICRCLLQSRRQAEKEGRLDFSAQIALPSGVPQIQTGEPVRVGRIEFHGNHHFGDTSVRRALTLDEGELFDWGRLRRSLARVNQLGFFEPVTTESVEVSRHPEQQTADITIALKERKRGRWSISGPVGPPSFAGPVEGTVAMRLPASTYFASATWMAFNPIAKYLPFMPQNSWLPIAALERPLIPGQFWTTGFTITPQLGWPSVLIGYGVNHALAGARMALGLNRVPAPELAVPVEGRTGFLVCREPKPRLWRARVGTGMVLDFAGRAYTFGAQ
jgi:outer membrane protein insertion porin family